VRECGSNGERGTSVTRVLCVSRSSLNCSLRVLDHACRFTFFLNLPVGLCLEEREDYQVDEGVHTPGIDDRYDKEKSSQCLKAPVHSALVQHIPG